MSLTSLSGNKELAYALICSVYGIGKTTAFQICIDTSLDPYKILGQMLASEEKLLFGSFGA